MKRCLVAIGLVLGLAAVAGAQFLSGTVKTADPILSLNASQTAYSVFDAMVASSDLGASDAGLVVIITNLDDDKACECRLEVNGTAQGWFPLAATGEPEEGTPHLNSAGLKVGPITDVICRTQSCTIASDCGAVSLHVSVTVKP